MKLHAAMRLRASKTFKYAMVNRPVGIGTCPKDGLIGAEERPPKGNAHYDMARNGVAVYDRKLSDRETKNFEMALMAEGQDLKAIAKDVADDMREYAQGYIDIAEGSAVDRDDFVITVGNKLKDLPYYRPSVGNIGDFANLVLKELK